MKAKILYIAGVLAHYTEDAAQPLHTTVDFDGRLKPDGTSPRSGIHRKVDVEVRNFALERARAAARFTATVWYSAWIASKDVKLPGWHTAYGR
jgi:hypothetical protein